jgi:hypothetical protein
MSLRAALVDAFKAEATISNLVDTRVFDIFYDFEDFLNSKANRVSKFPSITVESNGAENENNLDSHDNLIRETFTITCYQQVNLSKLRSRSNTVQNKERDILRQIDTLGDAVNLFIKDKTGIVGSYFLRSSHISDDTDDIFETEDNREIVTRVLTYNVGFSNN